jgi:Na+/H+-dicarboxylate symporter
METMQVQFEKSRRFRRHIMRRVWYVYSLSIIMRPALLLGVAFGGSAIAFWRLVSISSIAHNLLNVRLGEVPAYVIHSLINADTLALIAFSLLCGVGLALATRAAVSLVSLPRRTYSAH